MTSDISTQEQLAAHTVFSSAASELPQLEDAIRDAASRALEGMLGSVSFALLFTANYPRPRKYREAHDGLNAAEMLAGLLPPVNGFCIPFISLADPPFFIRARRSWAAPWRASWASTTKAGPSRLTLVIAAVVA